MTKFAIELERSTGIYYAGEVVRGSVKLTCQSEVTCRSFIVQLKGGARVHWHTGSGDNRTDYDAHTLFQDQRFTVRGSYYKTGLLAEAGENAYFDKIHNLGVVQIPCSSEETQRMQLIVRAMDYDWGKKDDLLGEILLDVAALANSGEKKDFNLTRKGRPEKGVVTISAKFLPYEALFPTTTASGVTIARDTDLEYCLVLHVHAATGLRKADWMGKNDVYMQVYRPADAKTTEILPGQKLPGPLKKTKLPANTEITAPFAFSLRHDAPPSAEIGIADRSHIRYKIRAYLDIATWKDPFTKTIITVIPNRPIPRPILLQPYFEDVGPSPLYGSCCKLSSSGMATIKLKIDRISYAVGEVVDISQSTIFYEGNKEMSAQVVLMGYYRLSTFYSNHSGYRESLLGTVPLIPHNEISLRNNNLVFRIPPVYPSFYGAVTEKERSHYACLKWTYTIGIKLGGEGCSTSVHAAVPVLVSSAPPYKEVLEKYQNLAPRKVGFGVWDIFDHAVLGPEEGCTTAPSVTGPEDGGTMVSVGGPINTWEGREDNYYAGSGGQDSMTYQPMITTFDGPLDSPQTQDTEVLVQETPSGMVDALLESMDIELDKRLAVGQWIRDHPSQAQLLSPHDFGAILDKVTFSLDQPSVVGELLSAFEESNKLTCQHIVSAMDACQYQKSEVASMMAPYASDPNNKEMVLEKLDYSFDKNSVSAKFESSLV